MDNGTDTQQLVTQDSSIGKCGIVLDDFDDDLPFIIASLPQSMPTVIAVALFPSILSSNVISHDVIDGHGIRAPPIFFS